MTDDGLSCFVIEYIDGVPITKRFSREAQRVRHKPWSKEHPPLANGLNRLGRMLHIKDRYAGEKPSNFLTNRLSFTKRRYRRRTLPLPWLRLTWGGSISTATGPPKPKPRCATPSGSGKLFTMTATYAPPR